jgi:thiol:disulfide interchange protein DsbD
MKKNFFFFLLSFLAIANLNAQILDPVKWSTKTEKISDTEFNLVFE